MAGYSETPLVKKFGIKEGSRIALVNPPKAFRKTLGPLPAQAKVVNQTLDGLDLVLFFTERERTRRRLCPACGKAYARWNALDSMAKEKFRRVDRPCV